MGILPTDADGEYIVPPQPLPDIPAALTAITGQLQLLGTVAETLVAVQQLHAQVVRHRDQDDAPPR